MPRQSLLQQFVALEKTFKDTCTYQNTGDCDLNDIVAAFFINSYTLSALADRANDTFGKFKINKSMQHYELQFGKMLGGDEWLERAKQCGRETAGLQIDARLAAERRQDIALRVNKFPN